MRPSSAGIVRSFVCAATLAAVVRSVPPPGQQQQPSAHRPTGGLGPVLWSALHDCLDDAAGSSAVAACLKSKALTVLDRALTSARAGKSTPPVDRRAELAAVDADPDAQNALLDGMLANRFDRLVSSRTFALDAIAGQEGRGKKKEKAMHQAMMMVGMMAAAVMGPLVLKVIALMAGKALLISKIALVLSGVVALKKLFQPQSSGGGGGGGHETESVSHHYGRSLNLDAHHMAYSGQ